jgi:hypothetical protein
MLKGFYPCDAEILRIKYKIGMEMQIEALVAAIDAEKLDDILLGKYINVLFVFGGAIRMASTLDLVVFSDYRNIGGVPMICIPLEHLQEVEYEASYWQGEGGPLLDTEPGEAAPDVQIGA